MPQESDQSESPREVALITGGARRIGAEIARTLHRSGMDVVIHYHRSVDDARALQQELLAVRPDSVVLIDGDLSDLAKLRNLVKETVSQFGRLDLLVNNASSFYPTPVSEATSEQWDDLVGVNLRAPFFLSQAAAPSLRESRGSIVNIVDIYAERPLRAHPIYCAAKAGLIALTRSLAQELAPEVRVNAVAPGAILWPEADTDQISHQRLISNTPLRRMGNPRDIARAVCYFAKDADFVTGQVMRVDGGRSVVP